MEKFKKEVTFSNSMSNQTYEWHMNKYGFSIDLFDYQTGAGPEFVKPRRNMAPHMLSIEAPFKPSNRYDTMLRLRRIDGMDTFPVAHACFKEGTFIEGEVSTVFGRIVADNAGQFRGAVNTYFGVNVAKPVIEPLELGPHLGSIIRNSDLPDLVKNLIREI